jgi:hypothetical protein
MKTHQAYAIVKKYSGDILINTIALTEDGAWTRYINDRIGDDTSQDAIKIVIRAQSEGWAAQRVTIDVLAEVKK